MSAWGLADSSMENVEWRKREVNVRDARLGALNCVRAK